MNCIGKDNKNLKFRCTTEEDIPVILEFINKIAEYEKMSDQVAATEERLRESIFKNKQAEVLLIELDKEAVGYIVYFFNFSTFVGKAGLYLEDVYVLPEYRGRGIGKQAFEVLAKIAKEHKCERMEWVCLDWNEPALKFYKSIGAKQQNQWVIHRLDADAIKLISDNGIK